MSDAVASVLISALMTITGYILGRIQGGRIGFVEGERHGRLMQRLEHETGRDT